MIKQAIALLFNNDRLEKVTKFKYLSVTINQHLTWHDHIDQLQRKVGKKLGVLKFPIMQGKSMSRQWSSHT